MNRNKPRNILHQTHFNFLQKHFVFVGNVLAHEARKHILFISITISMKKSSESLFLSGLTDVEQSKAGDQSTVTVQNHSDVQKYSPLAIWTTKLFNNNDLCKPELLVISSNRRDVSFYLFEERMFCWIFRIQNTSQVQFGLSCTGFRANFYFVFVTRYF